VPKVLDRVIIKVLLAAESQHRLNVGHEIHGSGPFRREAMEPENALGLVERLHGRLKEWHFFFVLHSTTAGRLT